MLAAPQSFGAVIIGNVPGAPTLRSDGATGIDDTSYVPMPADGTVDSVALFFQEAC